MLIVGGLSPAILAIVLVVEDPVSQVQLVLSVSLVIPGVVFVEGLLCQLALLVLHEIPGILSAEGPLRQLTLLVFPAILGVVFAEGLLRQLTPLVFPATLATALVVEGLLHYIQNEAECKRQAFSSLPDTMNNLQ